MFKVKEAALSLFGNSHCFLSCRPQPSLDAFMSVEDKGRKNDPAIKFLAQYLFFIFKYMPKQSAKNSATVFVNLKN